MAGRITYEEEIEFRHKLIEELHDIALSLRTMSGRDVKVKLGEKKKSYKETYFTRSEKVGADD